MHYHSKRLLCLLIGLLCLLTIGCQKEETLEAIPSTEGDSLLPAITSPSIEAVRYTPVYATAFEDTVVLATVPLENWRGLEAACPSREISNGGRIRCNGEHEDETPITKVLILEDLIPRGCGGWFRDMIHLEKVEGTERLFTHCVTDMSHMFSGCEKLSVLDWSSWDVSAVEDMAGMFDHCYALAELPEWYQKAE